jgi:uncharacterized repeat protein (TIGR03847 family)
MPPRYEIDLDPVTFITVGAVGPPGQRTFYFQAAQERRLVTLVMEKEQAAALAASIERLIAALSRNDPEYASGLQPLEANMALLEPLEPEFRIGQMGIGVDQERHVMVLVVQELSEEEDSGRRARFVASYAQMWALAKQATVVVDQGRPVCELCGEPIDPEGHLCPRRNGHQPLPED